MEDRNLLSLDYVVVLSGTVGFWTDSRRRSAEGAWARLEKTPAGELMIPRGRTEPLIFQELCG